MALGKVSFTRPNVYYKSKFGFFKLCQFFWKTLGIRIFKLKVKR
jgi:hypothetical protein